MADSGPTFMETTGGLIPIQTSGFNSFLADQTVVDKFKDSQTFAKEVRESALSMLNNLSSFQPPDLKELFSDYEFNYDPTDITYNLTEDMPALEERLEELEIGNSPLFDDTGLRDQIIEGIRGIEVDLFEPLSIEMPTFGVEPPAVDLPVIPGVVLPDHPGEAPEMDEIEMPERVTLEDPEYKDLDIVIPDLSGASTPSFEGTDVDLSGLVVPDDLELEYDESYLRGLQDEFLDSFESTLKSKIEDALNNPDSYGMSGLPPEVEAAIYDRAKARQQRIIDEKKQEILDTQAQRGFYMPPGALTSAWQKLDMEDIKQQTDLNIEIIKTQVEQAKQGFETVITRAIELRKGLLDRAEALAKHGVDEARYLIEMKFKEFEAAVTKKQLEQENFKSHIYLFGERIKAEHLILEEYKARLQKAQIEASLKEVAMSIFAKKVEINKVKADIYRTAVEAAKAQVEFEQAKIDVFRAKLGAYESEIRAKVEEYNAYRAKIAGEQSKVDLFRSQAEAYGTQVQAWSTKAQTRIEENRQNLQKGQFELDTYKTEIDNRRADLERLRAEVDAQIRQYSGEIEMFQARVHSERARMEAQGETVRNKLYSKKSKYESLTEQARMNMQSAIESSRLVADIASNGANIASQLSASAMTAVSASAQMSGQQSENVSSRYSLSASRQDSMHYSYQTGD